MTPKEYTEFIEQTLKIYPMDYTGSARKLEGFECENCGELLGQHYGDYNEALCTRPGSRLKKKNSFRNKALEKIYLDLPKNIQENFAEFLIRFFVR